MAGRVLTFALGEVVIEFSGEVKKTAGVNGGIKFWVMSDLIRSGKVRAIGSSCFPATWSSTPHGEGCSASGTRFDLRARRIRSADRRHR
jgi:hypothetical protein